MSERTAAEVLAEAAGAAGFAPSVHNTQPWRWLVTGDTLDLYADRGRQLALADPRGRLLLLSCGAALHHARVALAAEGWAATVTPLPTTSDADHIARLVLGQRIGVATEAMRTFQAVRMRHTDRRPVTDLAVPLEAVAAIRAAVEAEGTHLHVLRNDQVTELAVTSARADALAALDPALRAEMEYWASGTQPTGTGMPDTVIPSQSPHTDVRLRDFGHPGTLAVGAGGDRAATYVVIFGKEDTAAGWLRGGQAMSAAWLTATERGVAVLPFSAVVEAPATRALLRQLLAELGHPYLVLRLGMADPDQPGPPHTPRLTVTQTVEIAKPG